jgi:hypothetical protein
VGVSGRTSDESVVNCRISNEKSNNTAQKAKLQANKKTFIGEQQHRV